MEHKNLALAPKNEGELHAEFHGKVLELELEEQFNEALRLEYANVVLGVEPWPHEKKNWWRKVAKAKPWRWPIVLMDAFLGADLVRHVGPGQPPQKRHEWERREFY
ncbi:MAG: hypothetical protein ABL958_05225 [Bdellovibrionia bacterium]